jgi:hypothetical protein
MAMMKGFFSDQAAEKVRRATAISDMEQFQKEVERLAKEANEKLKDKPAAEKYAEVNKYVADFAKARGFETGATTELLDRHAIGDAAALKPLKDSQPIGGTTPSNALAGFFFDDADPRVGAPKPTSTVYKPKVYPHEFLPRDYTQEHPLPMAWRTDDKEARVLTFDEVKPKVEAAWRETKARALAKKAAEELAAQIKAQAGAAAAGVVQQNVQDQHAKFQGSFTEQAAKDRVKSFTLRDVAKLVPGFDPRGQSRPYRGYVVPTDLIQYPTDKMVQQMLEVKDKPLGTPAVVADQPSDTYYVAVLVRKDEKTPDEFARQVYARTAGSIPADRDGLYAAMRQLEIGNRYRAVIDQVKAGLKYQENSEALKESTRDRGDPDAGGQ